jgi:hypothetical protein
MGAVRRLGVPDQMKVEIPSLDDIIERQRKLDETDERTIIRWRDVWIRNMLADSELSPFTRLVGIRFALSVDLGNWQVLRLGVDDYAAVAADIGPPEAVVGRAVAVLTNERHWLGAYRRVIGDHVQLQLDAGPSGELLED